MIGTQAEAEQAAGFWPSHVEDGWRFLDSGCSRYAYLSPSGVVYKVAEDSADNDQEYMLVLRGMIAAQIWNVQAVEGVRLPITSRYRVNTAHGKSVVIAMEYIPQVGSTNVSYEKIHDAAASFAITDVHSGNYGIGSDGKTVILDLGFGNPEWSENFLHVTSWEKQNNLKMKERRIRRQEFIDAGFTVENCAYCHRPCEEWTVVYNGGVYPYGEGL